MLLHDAAYLYLTVLNYTLAQGNGPPDGKTLYKLAADQSFVGVCVSENILNYTGFVVCSTLLHHDWIKYVMIS